MKHPLILLLIFITLSIVSTVEAQKRRSRSKSKTKIIKPQPLENGNPAVIIDRRLAVLRIRPSLYAKPIRRISVGRKVNVLSTKEADGVTFYRVRVSTVTVGWMQADAVVGKFRKKDDLRLFKLVQAADGFDQVNKIMIFLDLFPKSPLRSPILLRLGDLMEEQAVRLSKKAARKLDRLEMAASGAPLHSFYLNFPSLDRYGKIGVRFLFNLNTKSYHYDGESWFEIIRQFPDSSEAFAAQKRIISLKEKMEAKK